jgi:uncharacterized protein YbjQ (UPF0145 family)
MIDKDTLLVTTTMGINGYHVTENLGIVRGIVVREGRPQLRARESNHGAGSQMLAGGRLRGQDSQALSDARRRADACRVEPRHHLDRPLAASR